MKRPEYQQKIEKQFRVHPVVGLLGPRQVGKTTLAKMYVDNRKVPFFDLENPRDLARLENPMLTLSQIDAPLIVIDEIQRYPELFPILRVLVDEAHMKRKFLVLGSASRDLIRQSSETLAGRIGYIELMPFSLREVDQVERLWVRGGFPRSYLAENDEESFMWRQAFVTTFLERDIPALGFQIPPTQLRKFWTMLVHYHGRILNASALARSFEMSDHTVRRYLDILAGTFMVRILQPWFENLSKRQVKTPKIYFRDTGILHALLSLRNLDELRLHPNLGYYWEGFALEETIRQLGLAADCCYFWGSQAGAELDLFVPFERKRIGFEFKYKERPKVTASMRIAMQDLRLDHLYVIYPGEGSFPLDEKITVCGLNVDLSSILL